MTRRHERMIKEKKEEELVEKTTGTKAREREQEQEYNYKNFIASYFRVWFDSRRCASRLHTYLVGVWRIIHRKKNNQECGSTKISMQTSSERVSVRSLVRLVKGKLRDFFGI